MLGDDVLGVLDASDRDATDAISANAYLGSEGIVEALDDGADVVVTGRVADAALFAAPLVHAHGWAMDDWEHLAAALAVGHVLECAGQVTGGYFADPGVNDVAGLADLGFPFADVGADGSVEISKITGTGGVVNVRTCTEQLLYEVHDPARYLTPDAVVDFSRAAFTEIGESRVVLDGVSAGPPPATLKVSVGSRAGFVGEGEISYAGPGCVTRADLALEILEKRLHDAGLDAEQFRFERIGVDSDPARRQLAGPLRPPGGTRPRRAGAHRSRRGADRPRGDRAVAQRSGRWRRGPPIGDGRDRDPFDDRATARSCPHVWSGSRSDVLLRELAHARSGDKGATSDITVVAFDAAAYDRLRDQLSSDRCASTSPTYRSRPWIGTSCLSSTP